MRRSSKPSFSISLLHALEGLQYIVREERNARIELVIAVLVILLSAFLGLSGIEWVLIIAAIGMVFAGEMLNTVIELTVDLITLEEHPLAKRSKDVAAGAILVASIVAAIMGFIILGPRLWAKVALIWH